MKKAGFTRKVRYNFIEKGGIQTVARMITTVVLVIMYNFASLQYSTILILSIAFPEYIEDKRYAYSRQT
jgi:hypothetical protein